MKNKILPLLIVIAFPALLSAETYQIGGERRFTMVAKIQPGGFFEAKTADFGGSVKWDGSALVGKITVKLETLDSGIGLRDSHMREKNIHTAKYPEAVFEPEKISGDAKLVVGETKQFTVLGKVSFHGKTRELSADVRAQLQKDGSILIDARLKLHLSDFNVEAPTLAFVKVEEDVTVFLRFTLSK
jgi:polyisoprenoid-binding protein YceI